jgi:hypothetical protein
VTKIFASVRNKGKLWHWRENYQLFTLHVFVLRDDFSERINRVIRGFAVLYYSTTVTGSTLHILFISCLQGDTLDSKQATVLVDPDSSVGVDTRLQACTVIVWTWFVMWGWVYVGMFWQLCECFGIMCTYSNCVLCCLYCVFVLLRLCIFLLVLSVLLYGLLPSSENSIATTTTTTTIIIIIIIISREDFEI